MADGRDMGTVVFPDAPLKIFLTASAEERARRRYLQLKAKGADVDQSALLEEIRERDERDSQRAVAPLKPADDAILLDSTEMSIEAVVETIIRHCERRAGTSEVSARELTIQGLVANIPDLMLWRFAGAARVASRLAWRHRRTTQLGIPIRSAIRS